MKRNLSKPNKQEFPEDSFILEALNGDSFLIVFFIVSGNKFQAIVLDTRILSFITSPCCPVNSKVNLDSVRYLKASIIPDENNIYLNGNKIKGNPYSDLNWKDNLPAQRLLDVITSILADEYIQIAKENPDTFKQNGGAK